MNLKEAFRYQKFLSTTGQVAKMRLVNVNICMNEERVHMRNDANPDAVDLTETVEKEYPYTTENLLQLLDAIMDEKQRLCGAINEAKASAGINIDAELEVNKFRQSVADGIRNLLNIKERKIKEKGMAYKINEEGNQTPYYYDIEKRLSKAYNEGDAKAMLKRIIHEADEMSARIDATMVTTIVNVEPKFDVNDSFEDIIIQFVEGR